jgi:hypothetical protein
MDPREWLFDQRVLRRNLDKGVLTWKAYQEYLKALPNRESEADSLTLEGRARAGATASESPAQAASARAGDAND